VREKVKTMLNLEMGNTPEIIEIALKVKPDFICLVPENRQEITTEGGLDVLAHAESLKATTARLKTTAAEVSFFIDPILDHVRAAADCGADTVELHTGTFANCTGEGRKAEVERLVNAACLADTLGLQVNAGHGLTTKNLPDLFEVPHLDELNIGHHLMSRALSVGVTAAVKEMLKVMKEYPG